MLTNLYNFWPNLNKFPTIWDMCCPLSLMCVLTLPWLKWTVKFPRFTTSTCWNLTVHFRQGSVGTHVRHGGQYIPHIVGHLLRCHCAKNYRNWLPSYCKSKKGISFFETQCLFMFIHLLWNLWTWWFNKNISCTHNTSRAFIGLNITPLPLEI